MKRNWSLPCLCIAALAACTTVHTPADAGPGDGGPDGGFDGGQDGGFCALPGSYLFTDAGRGTVPGAGAHDFSWLTLPSGFCVHEFANVPNARQLRFAPGGELFVASPTAGTTGGNGSHAQAAIIVIPDDDHDGVGDAQIVFKSGLPSTQGMLFANGAFYYQDATQIMREPYVAGQRTDNGQSAMFMDIRYYSSTLHWPKTLDISDSGEIYVGNGGDQGESCEQPMPAHGGIVIADGSACSMMHNCNAAPIVKGLRNPVDVKCHRDGHNHCFATELALDYSASQGGREKLIPIEAGDDWGFPCCATTHLPYTLWPSADCSHVTSDTNSFVIGNTPFGFDFTDAQFPAPWDHQVLVALHGEAGSWKGASLVAIATDPATGMPYPSSTTGGTQTGHIANFATGWDDSTFSHGRPSDVELAPDGRMFVANDDDGEILWIAPLGR